MHPPPPAAASAMDFSQNSLFGYMEDLQELTIIERPVRRSLKVIPGEGELPAGRPPAGPGPDFRPVRRPVPEVDRDPLGVRLAPQPSFGRRVTLNWPLSGPLLQRSPGSLSLALIPEGRAPGSLVPFPEGRPRGSLVPFPNPAPRNGRPRPCPSGQSSVFPPRLPSRTALAPQLRPFFPPPLQNSVSEQQPAYPRSSLGCPPPRPPGTARVLALLLSQHSRDSSPHLSPRHPRSHPPSSPASEHARVSLSPSQPGPPLGSQPAPILEPSCYHPSSKRSQSFAPILSHHTSFPSFPPSPSRSLVGTLLLTLLEGVNLL